VGQAFLGADGVDGLGLGVDVDAELAAVQVGDGEPELGNAAAGGVPVVRPTCAASHSLSTAISGDGMSGLPNPRSMMSSPARRAASFRESMAGEDIGR